MPYDTRADITNDAVEIKKKEFHGSEDMARLLVLMCVW